MKPRFSVSAAAALMLAVAVPCAAGAEPAAGAPAAGKRAAGDSAAKPAAAPAARKSAKKLPDRWWDAPSCPNQFQQTPTPAVSTVRLNSAEVIQWYRIVWLKIQRRLNGITVGGPYVVPCRNHCDIGPGGQVEIEIDPADFPDERIYEEADRRELGCVPIKAPKTQK